MRAIKLITVSTVAVLMGGTSLAIGLESAGSLQGSRSMQEGGTISQGGSRALQRGQAMTAERGRATISQGPRAAQQIQGQRGSQPRQSFGQAETGPAYGRASERNAGAALNAEQRARLREILAARRDIPRVSNLADVHVNAVIPRSVRMAAIPDEVARIYPRLRGRQAFIYRNEMVVVDPATSRIVARLPA